MRGPGSEPLLSTSSAHEHDPNLDAGPLNESEVLAYEAQRHEEQAQELQQYHPQERDLRKKPIGLALSGGGTRAAAFHCGVLWALAEAGLLKDVAHLSATSGGGYTAVSYMSHLYRLSPKAEHMALDEWYQYVMMRTVLRMQRNLNYLVEIPSSRLFRLPNAECEEEAGSSTLPRIFDLPLFVSALVISLILPPLLLLINTVWPIVLHIDMYHGEQMRAVWCDPGNDPWYSPAVSKWLLDRFSTAACLALVALGLNILSWAGFCTPEREKISKLLFRSIRHVIERIAILFLGYTLVLVAIFALQSSVWGSAGGDVMTEQQHLVRALCHRYVMHSEDLSVGAVCSDRYMEDELWFQVGAASLYNNASWVAQEASVLHAGSLDTGAPLPRFLEARHDWIWNNSDLAAWWFTCISFAIVLLVFIGSFLIKWLATLLIPIGYLYLVTVVARWKVFGPVTGQMFLPFVDSTKYSPELSNQFFTWCVVMAAITLPIYDTVLKLMHLYYRRALKRAFFHGGSDVSVASIATCPYCPNLLLGACLHDYKIPGERSPPFCDFTISSLFLGCPRTGFFYTPSQARLAHLLTVAGAATDASLLISSDILFVRLLISVLSFRFGDFLRLQPDGETAAKVIRKFQSFKLMFGRMAGLMNYMAQNHDDYWLVRWLQAVYHRIPAAIPFWLCQLLLLAGLRQDVSAGQSCQGWGFMLRCGFYLLYVILMSTFFTFWGPLECMIRSPIIQQFQMIMMHVNMAPKPPPYVYVSDGGLLEVTGLMPQLRRRMQRIVVSDAAEDPRLTMRCLRDVAVQCRKEKLCSFFDPTDPRRDLEYVLQDMPADGKACLHLGIRYEGSDLPLEGEIFYVRMRLPPDDKAPVRRLLTEEELLRAPQPVGSADAEPRGGGSSCCGAFGDLPSRGDMGGTCLPMCECGGLLAGRRFPHYNMSNQFLTPIHFANLCSLGAELSQPLFCKEGGVFWR